MGVPGVMTSQGTGGYGDGRVSIRGFSSTAGNGNVAYTINGIPVNDPETGTLYWSDFAGITDATRSIQVQRGLGASKIIVPSFGGTVNVTSRTTDQQVGGYVYEGIGSDGWNKTSVLVSTGLQNGWAATFSGSRVQGAYPFDGSNFLGYNYFFNLSKQIGTNQTLSFNLIGGTQTHGQRYEQDLSDYQAAPQGTHLNEYYGYKDGQTYNPHNNFFSEPILSLNHEWTINEKSSLSTVLYTIYGDGGGNLLGSSGGASSAEASLPRSGNLYTAVNYNALEAANAANPGGSALYYGYASHDKTHWYGLRSTYHTLLGKYIDLSAGIDLRYYYGDHYEQVTDLMGSQFVQYSVSSTNNVGIGVEGGDVNNPQGVQGIGGKINYNNIDYVESGGAFAQAEYSKDNFSVFATLSGSEDADKRNDPFDYPNGSAAQSSRWVNFTTYQAKIGANYNIDAQSNVFANVGYLTKPPYFANVFQKFTNQINTDAVAEKMFAYELGYQFKVTNFTAKLDLYRMSYRDRAYTQSFTDAASDNLIYVNINGLDEMHQGIELELNYRPVQPVLIGGMASIGDYYYTQNAGPATAFDQTGKALPNSTVESFVKGEKIGDIPQNLFQVFTEINIVPAFKIGASVNYYSNYTADVPFTDYTSAGLQPYKVPNYAIWQANAVYKFKMAGFDAELVGTVYNLLNSKVITDAYDPSATGLYSSLEVNYLNARTFTTALKVRF
jgi:iron complex outermembrane recepter protein